MILYFQALYYCWKRSRRPSFRARNPTNRFPRWRRRHESVEGRRANAVLARCFRFVVFFV